MRSTSRTPIAGFNGGLFVERDLTILEDEKIVRAEVARQAIDLMRAHGLDTWVYSGNDWLITKAVAPHVAREAWTVKFAPKVVADVREHLQQVAKIVGVSDDLEQGCSAAKPKRRLRSDSTRPRPGRNLTIWTSPTRMRTKAPWWNISRSISACRRRRLRPSAINQTTC